MREKYSIYEYQIIQKKKGWIYLIYEPDYKTIIREAKEGHDTEGEARLAAIGHIGLLENGEG